MDSRGNWHNLKDINDELNDAFQKASGGKPRYVMSCAIGETIRIEKDGGEMVRARFDGANGNKITLTPLDKTHPYLEMAERVEITNISDTTVPAQVWDNRFGKIVLRTLPVGS